MPHRSALVRRLRALPIALGLVALTAPAALAADAPTRPINLAANGRITDNLAVIGISADGREAVLNQADPADPTQEYSKGNRIVVRDQAAGRTTVLSDYDETALATSDDLGRVLFISKRALSPDDTNGTYDMYLHDRVTKINQLVSRGVTGGPALGFLQFDYSPALSGDGNAVLFSTSGPWGTPVASRRLLRFDSGANTITKIADGAVASFKGTDRTGQIAITGQGVFVGTRLLPIPATVTSRSDRSIVVSPNGRWIFTFDWTSETQLVPTVIDTASGTKRVVPGDGPLANALVDVLAINDAGTELLGETGSGDTRVQLHKYAVATGAATPYGGALPSSSQMSRAVSPGWAFWANIDTLAQIGSAPIPGSTVVPTRPPTSSYLSLYPGCRFNPFTFKQARRPYLTLRLPDGAELTYPFPDPVKADLTVRMDATGAYANIFSLPFGRSQALSTGWGGYTIRGTITYKDGYRANVLQKIAKYSPPFC